MNQGICYLYEYENNCRKRNIGFLQITQHYHSCRISLHLKVLPVPPRTTLELHAFYLKDSVLIHTPAAILNYSGGSIATQLSISESLFPKGKTLDEIDGFLLLPQNSNHQFLWIASRNTLPVSFVVASDTDNFPTSPEENEEKISLQAASLQESNSESNISGEISEDDMTNLDTIENAAVTQAETPDPETVVVDSDSSTQQQVNDSPSLSARKITRKELSILPREFWGLANNSFLLHGYHNYDHLLLIEEDGHVWLGVPGIYDTRESRAAELFGFPQFTRSYVPLLNLTEEERDEQGDFGHWCRYLNF